MRRVLFLQHGDVDKPGLLEEALADSGVELDVLHASAKGCVFPSMADYHGLALGGGGQSAYQVAEFPYLESECQLIRDALDADKPVLGLCLGGQLIARALGAAVVRAPRKEIGFFPVSMTPAAAEDPIVGGLPPVFPATHWHGDSFDVPVGGRSLAYSQLTRHQLFRFGRACYGFQFHLEMTPSLFEELVWDSEDYLVDVGEEPEVLIREARRVLPSLEPYAKQVFQHWSAQL